MSARGAIGGVLASLAILVTAWQLGSAADTSVTTPTSTSGGTGSTDTTAGTAAAGTADGTYTGDVVSTRFGNVQVAVTIAGGTITDVTALQLTDHDGRSVQISNRAAPILRQEVLDSQSAAVANVSGATYTTRAYLSSVQSALDQAGL
ncbi:FMN-binding protein [Pseudolysinimonas sp.]|uniref:FMN-binding protein n=1 Tax=Pseudolysinimonas sp. TaxID=2680009 RepID=UPI0037850AEF